MAMIGGRHGHHMGTSSTRRSSNRVRAATSGPSRPRQRNDSLGIDVADAHEPGDGRTACGCRVQFPDRPAADNSHAQGGTQTHSSTREDPPAMKETSRFPSSTRSASRRIAPEGLDVPSLRRLGADRDPHHPAPVEDRRGQVGLARAVDPLGPGPACAGRAPRRPGPAARGGRRPSAAAPAPATRQSGRGAHLLGQPSGVGDVAAQPGLQPVDALGADQAPELQGAEPAAERDAPVAAGS